MNRGIIKLTLRETWLATVLFALGLLLLQIMFAAIVPSFQKDVTEIVSRLAFVQQIFAALLGTDPETAVGPAALSAMPWAHPLVLAILWTHAILLPTRVPAGEIDRGTIDWLLALPLTRLNVFLSQSVVWLLSGAVLILAGFLGSLLGQLFTEAYPSVSIYQRIIINVNLLAVYVCVGGAASFFSAISNRRGRAAGAAFATVLGSFAFNALSTFNETIRRFDFVGILSYYRPLRVTDRWPLADLAVLLAAGIVLWTVGAIIFARRDLRTV